MLAREVVEDKTGALWLAMYDDNADVVSVLLEAGCEASVGILLAKLFIAEERRVIPEKRLSIIHQLLTANAENVNREIPEPELLRQCTLIRDSHRRPAPGGTLLHAIASLGHDALVRILLEHGADPTRRNTAGETPRDVAMRCQHISVVQIFDEARRSVRPLQDLCFFRARAAVAAGEIPTEEAAAKLTPSLARGVCSRLTH